MGFMSGKNASRGKTEKEFNHGRLCPWWGPSAPFSSLWKSFRTGWNANSFLLAFMKLNWIAKLWGGSGFHRGISCDCERPIMQEGLSKNNHLVFMCFVTSKGYYNNGTLKCCWKPHLWILLTLWTSLAKFLDTSIGHLLYKLLNLILLVVSQDIKQ